MFYICVCVGRRQHVIFGERLLALAPRWPLTQIKLPQFSPSPRLPQPLSAAHCQALLFSHGRLLREHAHICGFRGWQQSVLRLSSFFTPTYPSTQIELFSHFLSSPLNHLPFPYLPIMSNFIFEFARAKHHVLQCVFLLCIVVAHTECIKKVAKFQKHAHWNPLDKKLTDGSSTFGSWRIHLFKWPTKQKQTFRSYWVPAKTVSMSAWLEESSTNRPGLIQSISPNVRERERDMQKERGESKMVIWSEVRNETCHSKLEPCCLNYSGLLLKEQSAPWKKKKKVGRERVLSKKSERQTEGEMGKRKTREVIYSGSKRDKDRGRYEKKE